MYNVVFVLGILHLVPLFCHKWFTYEYMREPKIKTDLSSAVGRPYSMTTLVIPSSRPVIISCTAAFLDYERLNNCYRVTGGGFVTNFRTNRRSLLPVKVWAGEEGRRITIFPKLKLNIFWKFDIFVELNNFEVICRIWVLQEKTVTAWQKQHWRQGCRMSEAGKMAEIYVNWKDKVDENLESRSQEDWKRKSGD